MKTSRDQNLKRIIVDFKKLTPEILALVVEKFPEGYGDDDIITFRNAKGEWIEAVEIMTEDTKYLVKVSARLEKVLMDYDEEDYEDYDDDDPDAIQDPFSVDDPSDEDLV